MDFLNMDLPGYGTGRRETALVTHPIILTIYSVHIKSNDKLKEYMLGKLNENFVCDRLLCPHCHLSGDTTSDSE